MEIIRPGKLPEDKQCDWECFHCKALIRTKQSEGKYTHDQRDGDYVTFKCPQCNRINHVALVLFK